METMSSCCTPLCNNDTTIDIYMVIDGVMVSPLPTRWANTLPPSCSQWSVETGKWGKITAVSDIQNFELIGYNKLLCQSEFRSEKNHILTLPVCVVSFAKIRPYNANFVWQLIFLKTLTFLRWTLLVDNARALALVPGGGSGWGTLSWTRWSCFPWRRASRCGSPPREWMTYTGSGIRSECLPGGPDILSMLSSAMCTVQSIAHFSKFWVSNWSFRQ